MTSLEKLAARTVECIDPEYPLDMHTYACSFCKGSGRELDSRFAGIRWDYMSVQDYDDEVVEEGYFKHGDRVYCVNPDLGVLLEFAQSHTNIGLRTAFRGGWECTTGGGTILVVADTPIEAAAQAVLEWLEAQESEVTP